MVFHVKQIISIILFLFLIIAILTGPSHRESNNFFSIYLLAAKDTTLNFAPFFNHSLTYSNIAFIGWHSCYRFHISKNTKKCVSLI